MKRLNLSRFTTAILLLILTVTTSNCSTRLEVKSRKPTTKAKRLPPGQAKKIFGVKSARGFAPGHNKKS